MIDLYLRPQSSEEDNVKHYLRKCYLFRSLNDRLTTFVVNLQLLSAKGLQTHLSLFEIQIKSSAKTTSFV